jgi:uncharacterized protein involved in exopolysaccharide biosynthesis
MRDVKVQETVVTLLTGQYEQAKMSEARDSPVVQVLDTAVPADRKSRPKVVLNSLVAGVVGFLVAFIFALGREAIAKHRLESLPHSLAA